MGSEIDLKPCPFCGKEPIITRIVEDDDCDRWFHVRCEECAIEMGEEYRADAIAAWNRRAALDSAGDAKAEHVAGVDTGKVRRRIEAQFDEWVDTTGALTKGTGWYYECQSFIEDAVNATAHAFSATQPDAETTRLRERIAELEAERDYAVSEMKTARAYKNIETAHAIDAESRAEAAEARLTQAERAPAVTEALREALASIQRYGLDTLSGRTDGPDDREWQRDAVNEMTRRARLALEAAPAQQQLPTEARIAEPAVKPLTWADGEARTAFGSLYTVHRRADGMCETVGCGSFVDGPHMNMDAAKAAAQADYEARIRAALSPATGEGK